MKGVWALSNWAERWTKMSMRSQALPAGKPTLITDLTGHPDCGEGRRRPLQPTPQCSARLRTPSKICQIACLHNRTDLLPPVLMDCDQTKSKWGQGWSGKEASFDTFDSVKHDHVCSQRNLPADGHWGCAKRQKTIPSMSDPPSH